MLEPLSAKAKFHLARRVRRDPQCGEPVGIEAVTRRVLGDHANLFGQEAEQYVNEISKLALTLPRPEIIAMP